MNKKMSLTKAIDAAGAMLYLLYNVTREHKHKG